MRRFNGIVLGICLAWAALGACRESVTPSQEEVVASSTNGWTIIITDAVTDSLIGVVQTDTLVEAPWSEDSVAMPASLWTVLDGPPAMQGLVLRTYYEPGIQEIAQGPSLRWELATDSITVGQGAGEVGRDLLYEVVRIGGGGVVTWQGTARAVRFDAIQGVPMPEEVRRDPVPRGSVPVVSPAIVTLRMDDCPAGDAAASLELYRLGLVAEVAVPTQFVGRQRYCTWDLVRHMAGAGFAIQAHSRSHGSAPASFGDFYLETVGALRDLQQQGFNPTQFIQPGTWQRGYANFDSQAKFNTSYGQLLRRAYVGEEAYADDPSKSVGWPVLGRHGPPPIPLGFFRTPADLETYLRKIAAAQAWTHLMWHSAVIPVADLRARLEVVAALRDQGLIQVLTYPQALHAGRVSPAIHTDTLLMSRLPAR